MRRAVAAFALLLVASLLPFGPARVAPTLAADPIGDSSGGQGRTDARPVTPSGSDPAPLMPATIPGSPGRPSLGTASAMTPTSTSIYNPPPTIVVNQPHMFQIFIPNTLDGGTVDLIVDGVTVATSAAITGMTGISWTPPTKGSITVTATFGGTATLEPSTSDPVVIEVIPPYPSSVTISASPNPVVRNTAAHLSAIVTPDPGPGTVDFVVNSLVVGTGNLIDGVATVDAALSTIGYNSVYAKFNGNTDFSPRMSDFLGLYVVGDPVALEVTVPSNPLPPGPATATATLASDPGGGVIRWGWFENSISNEVPVGPGGVTELDLGTLQPGFRHLYVEFPGFGTLDRATADITFTVGIPTTTTLVSNRTTATVGELPVVLTATVSGLTTSPENVTFLDDVGGVVVPLGPVELDYYTSKATYSSNNLRVGVHKITARFDAPDYMPSTSAPVTVTVGPDTAVHASFAASMATFYPSKDAYKDTVALGGALEERASVTIRAYNRAGTLKRTWSLGSKATGKYSVSWDGKSSSHAAVPAGRYTVKASLKDTKGHTRTITTHVTVSWRKAVWKDGTLVTHYGDQLAYYANADMLFYSQDYTRGRIMDTGASTPDCSTDCDEIFGVTSFQLKTGVLDYRHVYIQINGHGFTNRDHNGTSFVLHPVTNHWDYSSPLPDYVGPGVGANIPISKSQIASTKRVTVILDCLSEWGDAFDIHWLRLHYQYAVWK